MNRQPQHYDVAIVGAGHGGAQAAITLRQHNFEGSIALIGDEPDLPYERPPLSKEYFAGDKPFERILIRPARFWEEREVATLLGRKVVSVRPQEHRLTFEDGSTVTYGKLIWATGGRPRTLSCSGGDLDGVHAVRTRADADAMMASLASVRRVAIIGGGYIGLEAAAVLTKLGKEVVLLEALDRVLARVAGEALSRFFEAEHRAHGVDLRTGMRIDCIEGEGGRASGVRLSDGEVIAADMVIVGIGVIPAVEPLIAAGAAGGNGVDVDEFCRTSLLDIYAIGDCASHANEFAGGAAIRLESVQNANDMAQTAVNHVLGNAQPYHALPWFWSKQYDLTLQTAGLSTGHDSAILRGDPDSRSFSVIYLKQGQMIAIDCVNQVKDYVQGRKLITLGAVIDPALLSNAAIPLKEMEWSGHQGAASG